jgi:hypothetical protein
MTFILLLLFITFLMKNYSRSLKRKKIRKELKGNNNKTSKKKKRIKKKKTSTSPPVTKPL